MIKVSWNLWQVFAPSEIEMISELWIHINLTEKYRNIQNIGFFKDRTFIKRKSLIKLKMSVSWLLLKVMKTCPIWLLKNMVEEVPCRVWCLVQFAVPFSLKKIIIANAKVFFFFPWASQRKLHVMKNLKAKAEQLIECAMFSMRQIQTVAHSLVWNFVNIL